METTKAFKRSSGAKIIGRIQSISHLCIQDASKFEDIPSDEDDRDRSS
jgi:hypothetical protein